MENVIKIELFPRCTITWGGWHLTIHTFILAVATCNWRVRWSRDWKWGSADRDSHGLLVREIKRHLTSSWLLTQILIGYAGLGAGGRWRSSTDLTCNYLLLLFVSVWWDPNLQKWVQTSLRSDVIRELNWQSSSPWRRRLTRGSMCYFPSAVEKIVGFVLFLFFLFFGIGWTSGKPPRGLTVCNMYIIEDDVCLFYSFFYYFSSD